MSYPVRNKLCAKTIKCGRRKDWSMRLATVGTSVISHHFLDALKHESFFELAYVYSRSEEKGLEFAKQYDVPVISDWNTLLNKEDIDVLYVASPNDVHFAQCMDALRANKHVICEKPFS